MGSQSSCCSNNKVKAEEENSEIITDGNIFEKKRYKTSINENNKILKDFSTSIIIRKYNSPSKIRKIIKIQSYIKMIITLYEEILNLNLLFALYYYQFHKMYYNYS